MKKLFILIILFLTISFPSGVFAQPMIGSQLNTTSDDHTAREEAEGKEIWEKLQAKQITCSDLTDENFEALGEYFMGLSIGDTQRHAAMNQMMTNMIGEKGEEQMHIILGKRSSGCDTNAKLPSGFNFMSLMWMMESAFAPESYGGTKGGGNPMMGNWGNTMFGGWGGFGFGWVFMILFWALLILGVIALIRFLARSGQGREDKTPLEILKERYAKGEIDKKEFEGKKKDLS